MMAYELGPAQVVEPDTMVRQNVVCEQCGECYDTAVRERIEGGSVEWTWTCPMEGCEYENWERFAADMIGFEG